MQPGFVGEQRRTFGNSRGRRKGREKAEGESICEKMNLEMLLLKYSFEHEAQNGGLCCQCVLAEA